MYHFIYCFNCNCFFFSPLFLLLLCVLLWLMWNVDANDSTRWLYLSAQLLFSHLHIINALRFVLWTKTANILMMSDLFHLVAIFIQNKPIIRLETIYRILCFFFLFLCLVSIRLSSPSILSTQFYLCDFGRFFLFIFAKLVIRISNLSWMLCFSFETLPWASFQLRFEGFMVTNFQPISN